MCNIIWWAISASRDTGILKGLQSCENITNILVGTTLPFVHIFCVQLWDKAYRSNLDYIVKLQERIDVCLWSLNHSYFPVQTGIPIIIDLLDHVIGMFIHTVYHPGILRVFEIITLKPWHSWLCYQINQLYKYCAPSYNSTRYDKMVSWRNNTNHSCWTTRRGPNFLLTSPGWEHC